MEKHLKNKVTIEDQRKKQFEALPILKSEQKIPKSIEDIPKYQFYNTKTN